MSKLTRALRAVFAPRVYYNRAPSITPGAIAGMDVERLFETQPHLRTVVSFLAANVAQLPLKAFITDDDGVRRQDVDGVAPTLLRHPNADMTGYDLIEALVASLKLYDAAIWMVVPDADSASGYQIRPIPIPWVVEYAGGDAFSPEEIVVCNPRGGVITRVPASSCIIWHGWSPSDPSTGSSPVESLRMVLSEQVSSWRYRRQQWDHSARTPAYISRPKDVEPWTDSALKRFKAAWAGQWEGEDGSEAGGTPVLEDGMELKSSPSMNFQDAQWSEACQLSLETVCMVYRLNPAMIGAERGGMTYASVKENARQLYSETLGPDIRMIQDRLNEFLLPMIGAPANEKLEFDLTVKLSSSFEEQVSQLQSAVGAPWLTRDEARIRMGYPTIDGGDELITPLNVLVGGLSSPTDTTASSYAAMYDAGAAYRYSPDASVLDDHIDGVAASTEDDDRPTVDGADTAAADASTRADDGAGDAPDVTADADASRGEPSATYTLEVVDDDVDSMRDMLEHFFRRQRASVLSSIGAAKALSVIGIKAADGDAPAWWDADRWDRELAADLLEQFRALSASVAARIADALGIEDGWTPDAVEHYLETVAAGKAHGINTSTLEKLEAAISGDVPEDDEQATPAGVFDVAEGWRAGMLAQSITTSMTGWAADEAIEHDGVGDRVMKTWVVTSSNPRDTHASMNSETVPYDDTFSNGARFPGDTGALDVDEVAGCTCVLELSIY